MANLATISGNILGDSGIDSIDLIVGTGTVNYIPKFTAEGNIGNSLLVDNGSTLSYNGNVVLNAANYNNYSPTLTGGNASGTWGINITGIATNADKLYDAYRGGYRFSNDLYVSYAYNSGTSSLVAATSGGAIQSWDNRSISPSEMDTARLGFGFTSWNNDNTAPWADYIHLRSYSDGSGGSDNLIMFLKSGIGMRIWQQSYGSGTAYSSYADVLHSGNYSSYAVPISGYSFGTAFQLGTMYVSTGEQYTPTYLLGVYSNGYAYKFPLAGIQSWLGLGNYVPISGGVNMTGSFGLNDTRLYLRTNGDNNHYFWNAGDDWEELNAYEGTGFRVVSNMGTTGLLYIYGTNLGGYTYSPYSFRAPIFYDSENTAYYADLASGTNLQYLNVNGTWGSSPFASGHAQLNITGTYPSITLRQTDNSQFYSLLHNADAFYIYTGRGATNGTDWNWGLKVMANQDGNYVQFRTSARAPIFYDSENLGYYVDPNGNSVMGSLGLGGVTPDVRLSVSGDSHISGYIYMGGTAGVLNSWGSRIQSNGSEYTINAQTFRFNNVGYGSSWNVTFSSNGTVSSYGYTGNANVGGTGNASWHPSGIYSAGYNWIYGGVTFGGGDLTDIGTAYATGSFRAPIFYDSQDTSFYLDPNSSSKFRNLYIGDSGASWSDPGGWGTVLWVSNVPHAIIRVENRSESKQAILFSHAGQNPAVGSGGDYPFRIVHNFSDRITVNSTYVYSHVYLEAAGSLRAPIFYDSENTSYYVDPSSTSNIYNLQTANLVVVGGTFSNNSYLSTTGTRLMFGGGDSDSQSNYYIGTNLENFGGNYNKLDIRFHTGIRIGAQAMYGGVRFYDSEDLGTEIFSVGKSGNWVQAAYSMRAPIFYDSDNTGYYADFDSTSTSLRIAGNIFSDGAIGVNGGGPSSIYNVSRIFAPRGAAYSAPPVTGAIKIKLPIRANDTMWTMKVRIYNYSDHQTSEYTLGNYAYANGAYHYSAAFIGAIGAIPRTVRFGNEGGFDCVWIGETSTSWSYPVVSVVDFVGGFSNSGVLTHMSNWDISTVTSFGNIAVATSPDVRFSSAYASIFYDSDNSSYYGNFAGTSVMNAIRLGSSSNNATITGNGTWGVTFQNDSGFIQLGPANGSYAHIYTDLPWFYFNKDLQVNGSIVLHSGNYNSYSPTLTGGGASGLWNINITGSSYNTTPHYNGTVANDPQAYFNNGIGLKVAMTGAWSVWSDTVWVNGYTGGDVPNMVAMHFLRNGQPRMALSAQSFSSTSYGARYEVLTEWNYTSYAVKATSQGSWSGTGVIDNVVGLLAWKNYGNSHVIFDASAGTTPSGTACSQTNSTYAWSASYPTLMGWNGGQTYGVRVDSSRVSDSSSYASTANTVTHLSARTDVAWYNIIWGAGSPSYMYSCDAVQIQSSTGSIRANSFFESSDMRIKTLVQDDCIVDGIQNVKARLYLKNGAMEVGYYAQDLQIILPSAISKSEEGMLNLSYREVHTAKIAYLEKKIIELENKINKYENN